MKSEQIKAKLLLYPMESSNIQKLAISDAAKMYQQIPMPNDKLWFEQLKFDDFQVAIIENVAGCNDQLKLCLQENLIDKTEFIFLSDGKPIEIIDKLMRDGAGYHFRQPIEFAAIEECLKDIAEEFADSVNNTATLKSSDLDQYGLLFGSSKLMHRLYRTIRKVSKSDLNVFITGESGVGKELVANTIHMFSEVKSGPFVAVNCGAISPELVDSELFGHIKGAFTGATRDHAGVFEQAENGTLFLDEVTEMPIEHQVKLLRVLEENEYRPIGAIKQKQANVRIIAATNRNPLEAIAGSLFREDLYYRLCQFPIQVPNLSQRGADKVSLAKHFLTYRNLSEQSDKKITAEALKKIENYSWPGNVRELKHSIERAFVLCDDIIDEQHIVLQQPKEKLVAMVAVPTGMPLDELEKQAIVQTLEENKGNKTETAEQLGVSVKTLYNKLDKYQED